MNVLTMPKVTLRYAIENRTENKKTSILKETDKK